MKSIPHLSFSVMIALICLVFVFALQTDGVNASDINSFSCADVTEIPQIECEALVALYNNTTGDMWGNHDNWLLTNTPSDWFGVSVSSGYVTNLYLSSNNLSGTIPPELGNLTHLSNYFLNNNQLSGSIPPELGNLSSLEWLVLEGNQLNGSIPAEFGNLTNLYWLNLSNNQLTGSLPLELGNLTSLNSIYLNNNQLSGSLPPELGNLTQLQILRLNDNQFEGDVPGTMINLTSLYVSFGMENGLDLDFNHLNVPPDYPDSNNPFHVFLNWKDPDWHFRQGEKFVDCTMVTEIPQIECEALVALYNSTYGWTDSMNWLVTNTPSNWYHVGVESGHVKSIYLSSNNMMGELPPELGNLTSLSMLDLYNNRLWGSLPPELGNLTNLSTLNLFANQFIGTLPAEFGNLTALTVLNIGENPYLTGPLPASLINLSLESFDFKYTTLCEPEDPLFQAWLSNILDLKRTGVICGVEFSCDRVMQIPQGECEALVALYNSTNGPEWYHNTFWLFSRSPSNWDGVTVVSGHVTSIGLTGNNLNGHLPAELGNLTWLTALGLGNNTISGSIPAELGNLTNLTLLYLSSNQLSESIPPELANLTSLTGLYLDHNQLTGSIPRELGNLTDLLLLILDDNQLSGSLPAELGNLFYLRRLYIYNNLLSGSIPPELGNLTNLEWLLLSGNQLSGKIPAELGNLTKLYELDLSRNQLNGNIPAELGNLTSLWELYMDNNQLSGSIPPELGSATYLRDMTLSNNQLSGSLPNELSNLANLSWMNLSGNGFTGSIPVEFGGLDSLGYLDLSGNQLSGGIPVELCSLGGLRGLDLSRNQLSGSIPVEIGYLGLGTLLLQENRFTGDIPDTFINLGYCDKGGCYDIHNLNLDYNLLNVPLNYPDPADPLQVFLSQKDPDWHLYQGFEQMIGTGGGELISLDGRTHFLIPANALIGNTTFTFMPQPAPHTNFGVHPFIHNSFDLSAIDSFSNPVTTFNQPLTATLTYTNSDVTDIPENMLSLYYWDDAATGWADAVTTCEAGEYTRDPDANLLALPLCHLTEFGVFGTPMLIFIPVVGR